jgi:hypothetical protein
MTHSIYVHLSDPILTPLGTERGSLQVEGFHALAGVKIERTAYDPEVPFEWVNLEAWQQRQARFWAALGMGLNQQDGPWQTSFELRIARSENAAALPAAESPGEKALRVSLWAKTFAPRDDIADQAAYNLVEEILALMPSPCQVTPIATRDEFSYYWGTNTPQWLGEARRGCRSGPAREDDRKHHDSREGRDDAATAYTGSQAYCQSDWCPTYDGLREIWQLIPRFPGEAWLSVGLCPTRVFPSEERALQERFWNEAGQASGTLQLWKERLQRWSPQAFLLRMRIAGSLPAGQWLANALGAVLCDPCEQTASPGQEYTRRAPAVMIDSAEPDRLHLSGTGSGALNSGELYSGELKSLDDWEAALFNWQWADFLPWGEGETPAALRRLRYLFTAREAALLGGIWG